jgi:predicted 3-demethylubiquinone-9 3-methyltransferase (glyoxalase superfamily)
VSWQVLPDGLVEMLGDEDTEKAKRTTEAMLGMGKLDMAALQRAYDGEYSAVR